MMKDVGKFLLYTLLLTSFAIGAVAFIGMVIYTIGNAPFPLNAIEAFLVAWLAVTFVVKVGEDEEF